MIRIQLRGEERCIARTPWASLECCVAEVHDNNNNDNNDNVICNNNSNNNNNNICNNNNSNYNNDSITPGLR